jgi:hypothetical protein
MIKKATIFDAVRISDLWVELMKEVNIPNRKYDDTEKQRFFLHLVSRIAKVTDLILVAKKRKKIIGFMTSYLRKLPYGNSNLIMTVDNVYIESRYRTGALFEDLIFRTAKFFKSNKAQEVNFETVYNPKLTEFWQRKGYIPIQTTYLKKDKRGQWR